jgi:hypothetical protein
MITSVDEAILGIFGKPSLSNAYLAFPDHKLSLANVWY